ncbi:hypothetical protein Pcinc_038013 [Petrolisthes cinctipes]|uniref:EGF-like domain-containing protein n=1 Tax=Petrolisthes cinctipes TaxID=88211 RepID=A0AAE1EKW8_PETCI|nr:hypothetical protein Pcinc_038013 [Petrolisthes cinctipes]
MCVCVYLKIFERKLVLQEAKRPARVYASAPSGVAVTAVRVIDDTNTHSRAHIRTHTPHPSPQYFLHESNLTDHRYFFINQEHGNITTARMDLPITIEERTGVVRVSRHLRLADSPLHLLVGVMDGGSPQRYDLANLTVYIRDIPGKCTNESDGSHRCDCPRGFYGQNCSLIDPCTAVPANPCSNGGSCLSEESGEYTCICPEGYFGAMCEHLDPCQPNPCQHTASCTNLTHHQYACHCPPGYTESCPGHTTRHTTGEFHWPNTHHGHTVTLPCPYGVRVNAEELLGSSGFMSERTEEEEEEESSADLNAKRQNNDTTLSSQIMNDGAMQQHSIQPHHHIDSNIDFPFSSQIMNDEQMLQHNKESHRTTRATAKKEQDFIVRRRKRDVDKINTHHQQESFLSLPGQILKMAGTEKVRVEFVSYANDKFFRRREGGGGGGDGKGDSSISSGLPVITARVTTNNTPITNLNPPVQYYIPVDHSRLDTGVRPVCVFWDEQIPICLVLAVNCVVFVLVTRVLCQRRPRSHKPKSPTNTRSHTKELPITLAQIRGAVTVVALLGVTWVAGALSVGGARLTLQYIFCLATPLQGLVIFIVRVAQHPEARASWLTLLTEGTLRKRPTTTTVSHSTQSSAHTTHSTSSSTLTPLKSLSHTTSTRASLKGSIKSTLSTKSSLSTHGNGSTRNYGSGRRNVKVRKQSRQEETSDGNKSSIGKMFSHLVSRWNSDGGGGGMPHEGKKVTPVENNDQYGSPPVITAGKTNVDKKCASLSLSQDEYSSAAPPPLQQQQESYIKELIPQEDSYIHHNTKNSKGESSLGRPHSMVLLRTDSHGGVMRTKPTTIITHGCTPGSNLPHRLPHLCLLPQEELLEAGIPSSMIPSSSTRRSLGSLMHYNTEGKEGDDSSWHFVRPPPDGRSDTPQETDVAKPPLSLYTPSSDTQLEINHSDLRRSASVYTLGEWEDPRASLA